MYLTCLFLKDRSGTAALEPFAFRAGPDMWVDAQACAKRYHTEADAKADIEATGIRSRAYVESILDEDDIPPFWGKHAPGHERGPNDR